MENNNDDTINNDLDTSWILHEQRIQNMQNNNFREPLESIHGVFIYINQNNYIDKITRELLTLDTHNNSHSIINSNYLLKILQTKKIKTPTSKYKFSNAFSFFVDLEPEQIQPFSGIDTDKLANSTFFQEISVTDNIIVPPSVFIFHNINTIYFFFQEVLFEKHNITLKSILKPENHKLTTTDKNISNNFTKKVRIFDKHQHNNHYKHEYKLKNNNKKGTRKRRISIT
tara:strand:+ start:3613 stop:4296 length:684 start_codon:yes stop_codon:yes gene_type:complete